MSFNVAMLEALQAEGLDLDACIRVLRAGEKKADPTNAERQARHRAKKAGRNAVTVTGGPPNDIYSNPPSPPVEAKASTAPKGRTDRGSRLPDDFEVPADWIDYAIAKRRWSRGEAIEEAEAFCRYWQTKPGAAARKRDWFKTWQNWVSNSRRPNGTTTIADVTPMEPERAASLKALSEARDRIPLEDWDRLRREHYAKWPGKATGPPPAIAGLVGKVGHRVGSGRHG